MAEVKANQNNEAVANGAEGAQPMTPLEKNSRIAAGLYLISQIGAIVLFAIFVRPQSYTMVLDNGLF
jgi:hypothetical protein